MILSFSESSHFIRRSRVKNIISDIPCTSQESNFHIHCDVQIYIEIIFLFDSEIKYVFLLSYYLFLTERCAAEHCVIEWLRYQATKFNAKSAASFHSHAI